MIEREVALVVEGAGIVQGRTVVQLIERDDVVGVWVGHSQVSYEPASTIEIESDRVPNACGLPLGHKASCKSKGTYMKPAPPVIMMFLTSGSGSNLVEPVKIGAFFQTASFSKKEPVLPFATPKVSICCPTNTCD